MASSPQVIVLAGPNGAGKSTAAAHLPPPEMPFINADEIAKGLPNYPSRGADLEAGRRVLDWMDQLEEQRLGFAVETTLSGRSLAARIARLKESGYRFRLIFVFLPNADLAVQRIAERVRRGGHDIPEEAIRRRYRAGIENFFRLYQPLADKWGVYETSQFGPPQIVAEGTMSGGAQIVNATAWSLMNKGVRDG